ncbi:glucose-dependent insulinotropic receptor-like [Penaeus chinensis]|uniref:glucose-dependent insulinotropic receptor-like n=1 Tax=Penaeus chinensis TaxID=139456 RepID=UPI001FB62D8D|nr:glucose-dependent insulinotropic receptor-like [Penaeus chinensis]
MGIDNNATVDIDSKVSLPKPKAINDPSSIFLPQVIIAFCVASGLVSCAVVSATPWVRRPMSPTVRLSLSLAAANTVFAASVSVALVVNSYLPSVHNISTGMCVRLTLEAVRMGSILVQILHLLVVALNHYIGTLRPLHYAATMTPSILKVILVALWIIPRDQIRLNVISLRMVGMIVAFASIPGQGYQSEGCQYNHFYISGITFRIVWTALFFGPTLLIIIVYCHIFHLLKHRGPHLVSAEQRNQLRRNIKTVRTTALIVGTFVIGWSPAVVKFILVCEECVIHPHDVDESVNIAMGATVNVIYCLKVFTDTFIYALRLRDIRKALQTMWALTKIRILFGGEGRMPVRNNTTRSSRLSYTASTRISLNSPAQHRFTSRRHVPASPMGGCQTTLEIPAYLNNHSGCGSPCLKAKVEETSLDPIVEDDRP